MTPPRTEPKREAADRDGPPSPRAATAGGSGACAVEATVPPLDLRRDGAALAGIAVLTALALRLFGGPAAFDFRLPWIYDTADGLSHAMIVKSIIHSGAFLWRNDNIGAPFGTEWLDYPLGEYVNFLLVKLIAAFSGDWVVVLNAFVLLGYFLAAATAYLVLRDIGLQRAWATTGALLFAFLPYHHLRAAELGHLFLAAYYATPFAVWLALRAWTRTPQGESRPAGRSTRAWLALAAVVVGSTGVYYAFFACILLAVAGAASAVSVRSVRAAVPALALVAIVGLTVFANLLPSIVYSATNGRNHEVGLRSPAEAERYGLKVTQMLLPAPGHRWAPARSLAARYQSDSPLANENRASALGAVGSVGLLLLVGVAFARLAGAGGTGGTLDRLALLALAAVLVGTVGGFGSLFAWTLSPAIRAWNRLSVFIGFISIAAVLYALQQLTSRWIAAGRSRSGHVAAAAAVLAVAGLWDQTTPLDRARGADSFANDRAFVQQAERMLPAAAMVYQLPYRPYPESGPLHGLEDYELFRGYLHSDALRWSYGAMKGREGDAWLRAASLRPIDEQIDLAAAKGYGAIYVDRRGYADGGAAIADALGTCLGEPVAASRDGARAVYRIAAARRDNAALTAATLSRPIEFAQPEYPAYVLETEGISQAEPWGRWTDGRTARIRMTGPLPERFTLELEVRTVYAPNAGLPVRVRVGNVERSFAVTEVPSVVRLDFDLARPADSVEFVLPSPASPRERGESADPRRLGIGLKSLRVVPRG